MKTISRVGRILRKAIDLYKYYIYFSKLDCFNWDINQNISQFFKVLVVY